ncbi:MAG: DNA-directed RNA polymerase subunit alpha C-terminal domain-containing protein [Patescibacteria group bacterium]
MIKRIVGVICQDSNDDFFITYVGDEDNKVCLNRDFLNQLYLNQPISEVDLSVRTMNCLINIEVNSLSEAAKMGAQKLLNAPNMGRRSLKEIKDILEAHGSRLPD